MGTKKGMIRKTRAPHARRAYVFPARKRRSGALNKANKTITTQRSRISKMRKQLNGNFVVSPNPGHLKLPAVGAITAGGAAQGAASVYMPDIAGFPTGFVVGGALVAVSMFVKNETAAGMLGCIGSGMLSAQASDTIAGMLSTTSNDINGAE